MTTVFDVKCSMPNVLSTVLYLAVQAFADQLLQGLHLGLDTRREKQNANAFNSSVKSFSTVQSAFAVTKLSFNKHSSNNSVNASGSSA